MSVVVKFVGGPWDGEFLEVPTDSYGLPAHQRIGEMMDTRVVLKRTSDAVRGATIDTSPLPTYRFTYRLAYKDGHFEYWFQGP